MLKDIARVSSSVGREHPALWRDGHKFESYLPRNQAKVLKPGIVMRWVDITYDANEAMVIIK